MSIRSLLRLLSLVLVVACSSASGGLPPCAPGVTAKCYPSYVKTLYASEAFSASELEGLRDGAAMWATATNGAVIITVESVKGTSRASDIQRAARGVLYRPAVGVTYKSGLIALEPDSIDPEVGLAAVFAHELGHLMGVSHSAEPGDLMFPKVHAGMRPTANDVARLGEVLR